LLHSEKLLKENSVRFRTIINMCLQRVNFIVGPVIRCYGKFIYFACFSSLFLRVCCQIREHKLLVSIIVVQSKTTPGLTKK